MGAINASNYLVFIGVGLHPTLRGLSQPSNAEWVSRLSLPDDPVGILALSLSNLVVGSVIQVEATNGTPLQNVVADATTKVLNIQAYSAGSPLNNLRIKVRKGSASPYYQPWETLATAIVGSQSIYVSQIPDE